MHIYRKLQQIQQKYMKQVRNKVRIKSTANACFRQAKTDWRTLVNVIEVLVESANFLIVAKNDIFTFIFSYRLIQLECNGSCILWLLLQPEMGQRARISITETLELPVLKCLATGWLASSPMMRADAHQTLSSKIFQFLQYKEFHIYSRRDGRWEVHVKSCLTWHWDFGAKMVLAESITSQVLHLAKKTCHYVTTNPVTGSYELGFYGYFCCVEKRLRGYWRKWKMFRVIFQNMEILSNDISSLKIEKMIS